MTESVWKFRLAVKDVQAIKMPAGAVPLHVGYQGEVLTLWAVVDNEQREMGIAVRVKGTGHEIEFDRQHYHFVGSVESPDRNFMWHVWVERTERKTKELIE